MTFWQLSRGNSETFWIVATIIYVSSTSANEFGEWLVSLRATKDWEQKDLAEKVGFSASYVGRIENGNRKPTRAFCVALAPVFGLTDDYVLRKAGFRSAYDPERQEDYSDVEETKAILESFPDDDSRRDAVELVNGLLRQMAARAKKRRRAGDGAPGATPGSAAARK